MNDPDGRSIAQLCGMSLLYKQYNKGHMSDPVRVCGSQLRLMQLPRQCCSTPVLRIPTSPSAVTAKRVEEHRLILCNDKIGNWFSTICVSLETEQNPEITVGYTQ